MAVLKQTSPTAWPVGAEAEAFEHGAVGEHQEGGRHAAPTSRNSCELGFMGGYIAAPPAPVKPDWVLARSSAQRAKTWRGVCYARGALGYGRTGNGGYRARKLAISPTVANVAVGRRPSKCGGLRIAPQYRGARYAGLMGSLDVPRLVPDEDRICCRQTASRQDTFDPPRLPEHGCPTFVTARHASRNPRADDLPDGLIRVGARQADLHAALVQALQHRLDAREQGDAVCGILRELPHVAGDQRQLPPGDGEPPDDGAAAFRAQLLDLFAGRPCGTDTCPPRR